MIKPHFLSKARLDTPACASVLHLNNAGSSLPPNKVLNTVIDHLQLEASAGGYEAARMQGERLSGAYASVARLINAHADEIAFVENATRAWDMAFYSIPFKEGDKILISTTEYSSNSIAYSQMAKNKGTIVEMIPGDESGQVSVQALENMIDDKVKLIAITHVPTDCGLVQPIAAIGKIAKKAGVLYLVDACQTVGQMPIDVQAIGCDFLSATGRKYLRGPRGTGFLYARKEVLHKVEPPLLDMHAAKWTGINEYTVRPDARQFESWEFSPALRLGLAAAVDYALELDLAETYSYIQSLAAELAQLLSKIKKVKLYNPGAEQCGIVTFSIDNESAVEIRGMLMQERINVSITDNMQYYWQQNSPELPSMIRSSVHYYNTMEEIHKFAERINRI
jgi:cysteine desulfurase / selenocysteine lyase